MGSSNMTASFNFFDRLEVADLDWVLNLGGEREFAPGSRLLMEGQAVDSLFVVMHGLLATYVDPELETTIDRFGPGEIIGVLSFFDGRASSSTVAAKENSTVIEIPFGAIEERTESDPGFGSRIYRTLGERMAQRCRALEELTETGDQPESGGPEAAAWQQIQAALEGFKRLFSASDTSARRAGGIVTQQLSETVRAAYKEFARRAQDILRESSGLAESVRNRLGSRLRQELLPFLSMSENAERWHSKPRGYAGDYLAIQRIYENQEKGSGTMGPALDRCFLEVSAARAVRNRRELLRQQIRDTVEANPSRSSRITSLACGPARELFDVFSEIEDAERLDATLIDHDLQALSFVSDKADAAGLRGRMRFLNENLVFLGTGRRSIDLAPQDLIYSAGVIDYFRDRFVVRMLNFIYDSLRPGGRVVLGNFHPSNPDRPFLDHIVEWRLIHRDEEDMRRIVSESKFAEGTVDVVFENEGVNLFLVAERQLEDVETPEDSAIEVTA
ncbi:MAG: cyclic nucleotide-binding domain-containing protein [Planctomycetota bacterium]